MKAKRFALSALLLASAARVQAQDQVVPPASQAPAPSVAGEPVAPVTPAESSPAPNAAGSDATATTIMGETAAPAPQAASDVSAPPATEMAAEAPVEQDGAAQTGELAQLTDAELASLGLTADQGGLDKDLHFSGFMDVNFTQLLNPEKAPFSVASTGDQASLFVGHFNLYLNKNLTESFRMMGEVRFTYSPNGAASDFTSTDYTYTQVRDYIGNGAFVRWGGILIERAYGEWSPFSFLNLRLGAFLTPYGIWNVDHGSPVFVPVMRPYAVNGNFFPEHQTGMEAFGRYGLTTNLAVRYHLTLSNGLGPISEYRDLDRNKAVGGRLAFEYLRLGTFQIGGSSYYGKDTQGVSGFGVNPTGTAVVAKNTVTSQSWVTAFAADLLWKYKGAHLQAEWVGQRVEYTKEGRTPSPAAGQLGIPPNAVPANTLNWAGYVLLGYRLPWWGIMPFGTLEYQTSSTYGVATNTAWSQLGLNIRPSDAIVLKAEYQFGFAGTESTQVKVIATQLAWAF